MIPERLPPEFPFVRVSYRCEQDTPFRFHSHCPGSESEGWDSFQAREYQSYGSVLSDLIRFKDQLWCHHCERGLFFPRICAVHGVAVAEEGDVGDEGVDDFFFWELKPNIILEALP
jgi:hypothetical protein